jgi:hypothetical protein
VLKLIVWRVFLTILLAEALALGGCDRLTDPPRPDATVEVPVDSTLFSLAQILPPGITITSAGQKYFDITVAGSTTSATLAALCPACPNGFAPKPAFTGTMRTALRPPVDVISASVVGGGYFMTFQNGFDFDPLRPGETARGTITVRVQSPGIAGTSTISGSSAALSPGGLLTTGSPAFAGGTFTDSLAMDITFNSPAGAALLINPASKITVTVRPTTAIATSAVVRVQNQEIFAHQILNVGDIDGVVPGRIKSGSLILSFDNPLGLTGTMTFNIGGRQPVSREIPLAAVQPDVDLTLSPAELRSFVSLGHPVLLMITFRVSMASPIRLSPSLDRALMIRAKLKLVITQGDTML